MRFRAECMEDLLAFPRQVHMHCVGTYGGALGRRRCSMQAQTLRRKHGRRALARCSALTCAYSCHVPWPCQQQALQPHPP